MPRKKQLPPLTMEEFKELAIRIYAINGLLNEIRHIAAPKNLKASKANSSTGKDAERILFSAPKKLHSLLSQQMYDLATAFEDLLFDEFGPGTGGGDIGFFFNGAEVKCQCEVTPKSPTWKQLMAEPMTWVKPGQTSTASS